MEVETTTTQVRQVKGNRLFYQGRTGELYKVWLKKMALQIITLGIYGFWGKTAIRKYLYAATELDGDRFEYLGTGKELFSGFAKVLAVYVIYVVFLSVIEMGLGEDTATLIAFILLPAILFVIGIAGYGAFRYRVNRLSWRGIRSRVDSGKTLGYGLLYLKGFVLKVITLGFMSPSVDLERWGYKINGMSYGSVRFQFRGKPENLRKTNIITLLLAIPTLFISRLWYRNALRAEYYRAAKLGGGENLVAFRWTATGWGRLKLLLGNFLIFVCTIGLGTPVVIQRNTRFIADHTLVGGDLSSLQVQQVAKGTAGDAEGMADILDIGDGLDIGF